MKPNFSIRVTESLAEAPDVALVVFSGKLGFTNSRALDAALAALETDGTTRVVVDLTETKYLNSNGAGVLVRHSDLLRGKGGALVLIGLDANLVVVVEMLGLKGVLGVERTLEDALSRVRPR